MPTHLIFVWLLCALLGMPAVVGAAAPNAPQDKILIAGNFKVVIEGADRCGADTVSVKVDPIEIEMHDVTESKDQVWREFKPGAVRLGLARFTFPINRQECMQELSAWILDVLAYGDAARRKITITLYDKKGRAGRRYTLLDTWPMGLAAEGGLYIDTDACGGCGASSANLAELQVRVGRVEMDDGDDRRQSNGHEIVILAEAATSDKFAQVRGFDVEITGAAGKEEDSPWTSVSGGGALIETIEETVGNDGERRYTPGRAYVSDITLTGQMTPERRALLAWMQATINRADEFRRDVTITPRRRDGSSASKHAYYKAVIKRITIPRLSSGSSEPIHEVVVLKPERYNDPP